MVGIQEILVVIAIVGMFKLKSIRINFQNGPNWGSRKMQSHKETKELNRRNIDIESNDDSNTSKN